MLTTNAEQFSGIRYRHFALNALSFQKSGDSVRHVFCLKNLEGVKGLKNLGLKKRERVLLPRSTEVL